MRCSLLLTMRSLWRKNRDIEVIELQVVRESPLLAQRTREKWGTQLGPLCVLAHCVSIETAGTIQVATGYI